MIGIILSAISLAFSGFIFYYFKKSEDRLKSEISRQKALLQRIMVEDIMFSESTKGRDLFKENVVTLARKIFTYLKRRYGLKATNYSELVEELRNMDMKTQAKEELIDFFNSIILLEYSKRSLDEMKKRELKRKAIEMIKRMGQFSLEKE